eukprot:TRINITY_DN1836_c0_g2_i1.p1 TRINITY_DN1836_c0_g2~~TRINITY_DN1836_c0_g2_i1.p1  ORF type:complete len:792 (+),score=110.25 TRINITY_DN1836_c0_g2_i1:64-2439(+)
MALQARGACSVSLAVSIFAAVATPDAVILYCFSAMGAGLTIYDMVADGIYDTMANGAAVLSATWLAVFFVLDYENRGHFTQFFLMATCVCLFMGAAVLKASSHPWAPVLVSLVASLVMLGHLRKLIFSHITRGRFYFITGMTFALCAALIALSWFCWMFIWHNEWRQETIYALADKSKLFYEYDYHVYPLSYERHCMRQEFLPSERTARVAIMKACRKARTVWWFLWISPCVATVSHLVLAVFCFLWSNTWAEETPENTNLLTVLKQFVLLLTVTIAGMYCAIIISGAFVQMGSACMAFWATALIMLLIWVHLEVDHNVLFSFADESKLAACLLSAIRSDWVRAIAVGGVNFFIPIMVALDMMRQKVRTYTGTTTSQDKYTEQGRKIVNALRLWNWCSIFSKVNVIGEIFFIGVLGMKVAYVFFSSLTEWLEFWDFGIVVFAVFVSGMVMFMCPIIPGSAVYVFAGVVIGGHSLENGVGFWPGVMIAIALGTVSKMMACVGQYAIGYVAGKNVRVQQWIGVDRVPTRAIEQILREDGWAIGKVSILVAGPDWPTSVTCGILGLHVPQMLLGTLPVIVVSIAPQTLVGALLHRASENGLWSLISAASTGLAGCAQGAATLVFSYSIMKTIERDGENLAKFRTEHAKVAQLRFAEKAYVDKYAELCKWSALPLFQKVIILISVTFQLVVFFVVATDFAMEARICFRPFAMTDKIGDGFEDNGLGGSVFNLVVMPVGWIIVGLFVVASLLHGLHLLQMNRAVRRRIGSAVYPEKEFSYVTPTEPGAADDKIEGD